MNVDKRVIRKFEKKTWSEVKSKNSWLNLLPTRAH